MGLDISFDAFHGAYSSFNSFRKFVAASIGGSYPHHDDKSLDDNRWYWGDGYNQELHPGLYEFFCHSDCDGEISPEMCNIIANELESILPLIEKRAETHESYGHILRDGGFVAVTKRYINGCRKAVELNEPLVYG